MHTRRRLLQLGTAALGTGLVHRARAQSAEAEVRKIAFDNLHTGEKLSVDYWIRGRYDPDALTSVNRILRDYRNGQVHVIEPKLLDLLAVVQARLESSAPFSVISGYRSPETNAMLHQHSDGVAAHSLHIQGMAIDLRLADRALKDLHRTAVSLKGGGVGYYPSLDFVHIDVGRVRYWGASEKST